MIQSFYLPTVCAATYGTLAILIAMQARQVTNFVLAGSCLLTSAWAAISVAWPQSEMTGVPGLFDALRMLSWYGYLLHLYRRSRIGPIWQIRIFLSLAALAFVLTFLILIGFTQDKVFSLFSAPIILRLTVAISELLLIENLYFNLPEHSRWHIALPCVLLGGIACFDILIAADAVLFHRPSVPLTSARLIILLVIAPLLVLAAFRGQRWNEPVRLSRIAVFHSATLVLSGSVLLALALTGELLRRLNDELGWIVELSLVSLGLLGLMLFLSSRSARSIIQRVVVRHFFADRYDYRFQWLQCIATLSGTDSNERTDLPVRAIRAVADVVNSPSGSFYCHDASSDAFTWAGSWNMPVNAILSIGSKALREAIADGNVVDLLKDTSDSSLEPSFEQLGPVWLAVPLLHSAGVIGLVIVGPPRVPFRLDQEVFDLLRILGREVATYIVEQQATEAILQTRELHDYSKRFAFVAHDIKNVSSQLALLLKNAEHHLSNPEFQQDMLETVRASVRKIDLLLKRLDQDTIEEAIMVFNPVERLRMVIAGYKRSGDVALVAEHDGPTGVIKMDPDKFDTVIMHLLNNAVEAGGGRSVEIRVSHQPEVILIDIVDNGVGMSADFIRHELFAPFRSNKQGGSGIGAYQARELLKEGGGHLLVTSCKGIGTTMRVVLPRSDVAARLISETSMLNMVGVPFG